MNKKKIAIGAGIALVALLGATYVVSYFVAGNQVPARASVEGIAIGGLTPEAAESRLKEEFEAKVATAITLSSGEVSVTLTPAEAGLSADYAATVVSAGGGFSWSPFAIFKTLTGGSDVSLVRTVDQEALGAAIQATVAEFAADPVDASLAFENGEIVRTEGTDGSALNLDSTVSAVSQAFKEGKTSIEAVVDVQAPSITNAMVDEAISAYATPLLSGPVTLTAGNKNMQIDTAALAAAATTAVADGKLTLILDADKLYEATEKARETLKLGGAKDASFALTGSGVSVVPAEVGQNITKESLAEAVQKVAFGAADARTTEVAVETEQPEFTTEAAEALGEFEVIGEFTTYFPHASYRNTNLGQAAKSINGTVLMPDQIFSLNDTLGPRTAANGYVDGYVINNGRLVQEAGGGISQSATTLYNAAFFAGYKDIEHRPHTLYFDRYPAGREATIYFGSLDMRFQNDTQYPSIIEGRVVQSSSSNRGSITFKIWSKRTYQKVESTEPVKSGFYAGSEIVETGPNCEAQAPIQGFTATWQRLFYQNGSVVKTENYSWKYSAGNKITCE